MSQVIKTTQTTNAQVLRDEVVLGANTNLRVYNLLKNIIDSALFWDIVKQATGSSTTDLMSQKAITDAILAGTPGQWIDCGEWDGSTDEFPETGGTAEDGTPKRGNTFECTDDTVSLLSSDGSPILRGQTIRALIDNPGNDPANWRVHP